ncbi:MAG: nucleotide exchange factor GrpE [Bacilli bacterium]|nr:nucleotide exchange factor GrpE [Bacilli bacterium]
MEEEVKVEEKETKKEKKNKEKELIDALNLKVKELEDKNLRISAEMINSLRRKDEDTARVMKYANESLIDDILNVVDNFDRALKLNSDSEDVVNYQKGMQMIYDNLISILNKYEVIEIDALDKPFDPTYHQAVMTEKVDGKESNIVIEVLRKGYMYKDKVIRPAMVKVSE